MTGSVVIAEVHALIHVVLSKAEKKHVPYGELVGTTTYNVRDGVSQ